MGKRPYIDSSKTKIKSNIHDTRNIKVVRFIVKKELPIVRYANDFGNLSEQGGIPELIST